MSDNRKYLWFFVVAAFFFAGLAGYADYRAYRLRFPHAPGWTYLFR